MLKLNLEKANDQNLASALQKLASLEKIDVKTRFRAGRIFDALGIGMRENTRKMEKLRHDFIVMENGKAKVDKQGNILWNAPDAQEKYLELFTKTMSETEVEVKSHKLDWEVLSKLEALSGTDLVALEIVSDGVPKVA